MLFRKITLPPAERAESQERDLSDAENVDYSDGDSNDEYGEDEHVYAEAPHRQMYMQQQQLIEVAQAIAPKPGSRSTTTMSGIGVGGSSDKPPSSKEKALRRKILELEYAWQQEKASNLNLDHHYRKLWNRANAQSEELKRSQEELEAVKAQLADAKTDFDENANEEETWDMRGGSDILLTAAAIQMVDVLNVEVRRVAAVLGKVLQKAKFEEGHRQIMQITEKARLMLGENMVALLSTGLPEKARVDPLFVQVVLQVAVINWCKTTISSWKPGNSDVSNLLVELYSKIREVGEFTSTFKTDPPLRHKYLSFQKIQRSTIVGGQ